MEGSQPSVLIACDGRVGVNKAYDTRVLVLISVESNRPSMRCTWRLLRLDCVRSLRCVGRRKKMED